MRQPTLDGAALMRMSQTAVAVSQDHELRGDVVGRAAGLAEAQVWATLAQAAYTRDLAEKMEAHGE